MNGWARAVGVCVYPREIQLDLVGDGGGGVEGNEDEPLVGRVASLHLAPNLLLLGL